MEIPGLSIPVNDPIEDLNNDLQNGASTHQSRWWLGPIAYAVLDSDSFVDTVVCRSSNNNWYGNSLHAPVVEASRSSTLVASFTENETEWTSSDLHVAFPMTPNTTSSVVDGKAAYEANLPYWGIPNGVDAYAEFYVRLTNTSNNQFVDTLLNSLENPFVLFDAPYLTADSLIMDFEVASIKSTLRRYDITLQATESVSRLSM